MNEMVINARTLPETLFRLIRTDKVKVNEANGVIKLTPILDAVKDCPLRGLASDSNLTVEKFLAMTREEKDLEL